MLDGKWQTQRVRWFRPLSELPGIFVNYISFSPFKLACPSLPTII